MTENSDAPEWVAELGEAIVSTIQFQGPAYIEWYYSKAEENEQGVDLLELYPALVEIEEAGPYDGEIVFVKVNSVDILAAQRTLDDVEAVTFGIEAEDQTSLSIEGSYQGHPVNVVIYFEPAFDDDIEDVE